MTRSLLRTSLVLSLLATPALAFQARNGVEVTGSAGRIEVQPSAGQGASQSWCAAGDFVLRGLGLPGTTPVYRLTPPPRRGGEGVVFSLSPEGASDRTGVFGFGTGDNSLSAAHAQALCLVGRWRL